MILLMVDDVAHVGDGDLIRLLDGECAEEEERQIRGHVAACADCCRKERELAALSERFSTAVQDLEDADTVPSPRPRVGFMERLTRWLRSRRLARAGAALIMLLALAMLVSPVRAMVLDQVAALTSWLLGPSVSEEQGEKPTATLSFVPSGDRFLVHFSNRQASGTLTVLIDTGTTRSARMTAGGNGDEILVLQEGIRIDNSAQSSASYELRLPPQLSAFEVRIAGVSVARYDLASRADRARWEIDLGRRSGR